MAGNVAGFAAIAVDQIPIVFSIDNLRLVEAVYDHRQSDPARAARCQFHDAFIVSAVWMHIERRLPVLVAVRQINAERRSHADDPFLVEVDLELRLLSAAPVSRSRTPIAVDCSTSTSGTVRILKIVGQLNG